MQSRSSYERLALRRPQPRSVEDSVLTRPNCSAGRSGARWDANGEINDTLRSGCRRLAQHGLTRSQVTNSKTCGAPLVSGSLRASATTGPVSGGDPLQRIVVTSALLRRGAGGQTWEVSTSVPLRGDRPSVRSVARWANTEDARLAKAPESCLSRSVARRRSPAWPRHPPPVHRLAPWARCCDSQDTWSVMP